METESRVQIFVVQILVVLFALLVEVGRAIWLMDRGQFYEIFKKKRGGRGKIKNSTITPYPHSPQNDRMLNLPLW